jgi:hypothetical protein
MDWFRVYAAARHDPKIQLLPAPLFRQWFNLLCLSSDQEDRGSLPDFEAIAFELHVTKGQAKKVLEQLWRAELVDQDDGHYRMHGWERRQFIGDDATARTRRFRERQHVSRNGSGTFPERPQRTDAETEDRDGND